MLWGVSDRAAAIDAVHFATALFTSHHVVDALLERVGWPERGGSLLDPSCGDGAFLVRALLRLAPKPGDFDAVSRIAGWEFHSGAVAMARNAISDQLVSVHRWSESEAAAAAFSMVEERDFLTDAPEGRKFVTLVGNPPYLRLCNVPQVLREEYRITVPEYARADLMHGFLERCAKILPAEGVIGLVVADRFLFNETAAELREELGRKVGIDYLARLDASTSFYRPKTRRQGAPPRIHPVEIVLRPAHIAQRPITSKPISPDDGTATAPEGAMLGDIAEVRLAPWLGPKGIFVIDAAEVGRFKGVTLLPAVDTDDVNSDKDTLRPPSRYAIRTSAADEPDGVLRDHLLALRNKMPKRSSTRPYWLPPESITLPLNQPALMVPRIARRLRAIPLPAGILPINHNLSVISTKDGLSLSDLKALLESEHSQEWIRRNAPRLENGFFSITTKLLRRMPVPPLSQSIAA
jgi:hypothetical protein